MKTLIAVAFLACSCIAQDHLQPGTLLSCIPHGSVNCYEHVSTTKPLFRVRTTDTEYLFIRRPGEEVYGGTVNYRLDGDRITVFSGGKKIITRRVIATQPSTELKP